VALSAACAFTSTSAKSADLEADEASSATPEQVDARRFGYVGEKLHDWNVTLGGGAIFLPEYEGSDKFKVLPFPVFSASFRDTVHVDPTGVLIDLYKQDGFRAGLKGGYELGRKEDDSDYLRGLGNVDPGAVIGGVISYERGPFEVYAELDKTIGGSDGLTGTVGAKVSHRYERFVFSGDVSATWADEKHMEAYFGITPDQSARSGLPEYEAKAGIKRIDVKASVTYLLTDNWFVTGSAGAGMLVGDAKDSPIVRDEIQPFGMLGLGYRF
jgi:outer membrane scaffolding protein for murein synthesis (MipA/OmpV family)